MGTRKYVGMSSPRIPQFGAISYSFSPHPTVMGFGADPHRNKALGQLQPHLPFPGARPWGGAAGPLPAINPGHNSRPEFRPCVRPCHSRAPAVPMSFSRRTVYSSSVRSGGMGTLGTAGIAPGRRFAPLGSAASVYAGAGGAGSRISVSRTLSSAGGAFRAGYGAGLGGSVFLGGSGAVANEKEAMQDLNDRLATYLEQVRRLEQENRRLETQIREFMAQKGPSAHDWSPQWELIEELRDKVGGRGGGGGAMGEVCKSPWVGGVGGFPPHGAVFAWGEGTVEGAPPPLPLFLGKLAPPSTLKAPPGASSRPPTPPRPTL
ncbi:hypothetical protein DV515_00019368, partial [Chloebia gouldiae]